jgi:hypothetical protein
MENTSMFHRSKKLFLMSFIVCFMLSAGVGVVSAESITFSNVTAIAIKDTAAKIQYNTDNPLARDF